MRMIYFSKPIVPKKFKLLYFYERNRVPFNSFPFTWRICFWLTPDKREGATRKLLGWCYLLPTLNLHICLLFLPCRYPVVECFFYIPLQHFVQFEHFIHFISFIHSQTLKCFQELNVLERDACIRAQHMIPQSTLSVCMQGTSHLPFPHPPHWYSFHSLCLSSVFLCFLLCLLGDELFELCELQNRNPDEEDQDLGGEAMEAKRRLDEKFSAHMKPENQSHSRKGKNLIHGFWQQITS